VTGFAGCRDFRVNLFHRKLVKPALSRDFPRLLKPLRHEVMLQHLQGILFGGKAPRCALAARAAFCSSGSSIVNEVIFLFLMLAQEDSLPETRA
jgi:hypothetical protein